MPDRQKIYAAISDSFYDARNSGRTMTAAANDATDRVLVLIGAARENVAAEPATEAATR